VSRVDDRGCIVFSPGVYENQGGDRKIGLANSKTLFLVVADLTSGAVKIQGAAVELHAGDCIAPEFRSAGRVSLPNGTQFPSASDARNGYDP
jgi:hypothetical protein